MASEPEFTVSVEGAFDEQGVWVIDTRVALREDVDSHAREDLVGHARLALLRGIAREGFRGRGLGATKVRVSLDDPGREFFPDLSGHLEPTQ